MKTPGTCALKKHSTARRFPHCTRFYPGGSDRTQFIYVSPLDSRRDRQARPKPMEEKRKHPRTEIDEPAYVSAGGSVMSCIVRNISAEGAAIDIENPTFVPPQFRLVMADGSSVRECRIAWIQQKRIGVTFTAMPPEPQPSGHEIDG